MIPVLTQVELFLTEQSKQKVSAELTALVVSPQEMPEEPVVVQQKFKDELQKVKQQDEDVMVEMTDDVKNLVSDIKEKLIEFAEDDDDNSVQPLLEQLTDKNFRQLNLKYLNLVRDKLGDLAEKNPEKKQLPIQQGKIKQIYQSLNLQPSSNKTFNHL